MTQPQPRPAPSPAIASRQVASSPKFCVGLAILSGLALIACAALAVVLPRFRPQIVALLEPPAPAAALTPACGLPTLSIGGSKLTILPIRPGANGSLDVPADSPDTAYWIEGGKTQSAFALSPAPKNLVLKSSLKVGDPVVVTWDDCNSSDYEIASIENGTPGPEELQDQSTPGVLVFMPAGAAGEGFVVRGVLQGERLETVPTPASDAGGRQAEISLLETTTSADGSQLLLKVSFLNYGKTAFSLTSKDILLVPDGASPLSLTQADPALPAKIQPGETRTFTFTFPKPPSPTATLKIFDVEFSLDRY